MKKGINILEHKGISIQIDLTPGHSDIAGNEAKEAAKEAETFKDDRKFTSIAGVKMTYKKYVIFYGRRGGTTLTHDK